MLWMVFDPRRVLGLGGGLGGKAKFGDLPCHFGYCPFGGF